MITAVFAHRALSALAWLNIGGATVALWADNGEAFARFAQGGAGAAVALVLLTFYRMRTGEL